jgi:hypothetical protein
VNIISSDLFANLAKIRVDLKAAEKTAGLECEDRDLRQAREVVIGAVSGHLHSRFELGRALWTYKTYFKAEHGWVRAAAIIAAAIQTSERTLMRIVAAYERAAGLPATTLALLDDHGVDPAVEKNRALVEDLLEMTDPATREESKSVVVSAIETHLAQRRERQNREAKKGPVDLKQFADHLATLFKKRYRHFAPERRDAELRHVLEVVIATLGVEIPALRRYDNPTLVPSPESDLRRAA